MYILFSVSSDSSVPQLGRLHSTFNLIQSTLRPVAFAHFVRLLCAATRFVLFHFFITSRLAGFGEKEHRIRITCLPCSSEHAHIRYHAFYRYVTLIPMRVTRLIQLAHRPAPFSPSLSLSLLPLPPSLFQPAKDAQRRLKNSIVSGVITNLFSVLSVLMKILSHATAKKKTKRLKGLNFRTFIGRFQVTSWQ